MSRQTNRDSDKFMLRLPEGMRDRVKAVADLNSHSMNAEIVEAIDRHLDIEEYRHSPEASQVSSEVAEKFASEFRNPQDLPATKSDIEKLYQAIKGLAED